MEECQNGFDEKTKQKLHELMKVPEQRKQEHQKYKNRLEHYQKFFETHYQKAYELETVKELIQKSGMEFVAAYDAFTREPVRADSERIYIIAREKGKKGSKQI